jgi:hypothetical protein
MATLAVSSRADGLGLLAHTLEYINAAAYFDTRARPKII